MRRLIVLKSKYSIDEQLKNLEDKNVQFNIMSKEEAREYLQNNTYYFKLIYICIPSRLIFKVCVEC